MINFLKIHKIAVLLLAVFFMPMTVSADVTAYVDNYNRFILNGEPFFPLGLYVVECTNGSYTAELDEIADSPFDTLMNYNVNGCGTDASDTDISTYLDQLASRDLKLIFSLSEYFDGAPSGTATWTFTMPVGGTHDLYGWWTAAGNRADNVPYTVSYDAFSQTIAVNQEINGGQWNRIGTFTFAGATSGSVVLGNDANGYVVADAIGWDIDGDTTPDIIVDDLDAGFSTQGSGWMSYDVDPQQYNGNEHQHAKFSDDIAIITQKVDTFKTHPAVISWYLNDERDPATYLTQLEDRYATITQADGDHPVWSVHWNTDWLLQEAHTTDIVGMDSYPIDNLPITVVGAVADTALQAGKPLWFVPQIFDWRDYPGDPAGRHLTGRPPTREEMRAMTYLATNHGAKGLIYYSYFNIVDDDIQYGTDVAGRWEEIKGIASEIEQLRPVFLSIEQTNDNDVTCSNSNIDFKLMKEGGTYYLFAVNTREEIIKDVSFGIDISLPDNPSSFAVLFEGNKHLVDNDSFIDNFGPYEVHVYEGSGDIDSDGSLDNQDNCPFTFNPNQDDFDGDDMGDACDRGDLCVESASGDIIAVDVLDPEDAQFDSPDKPENLIYGVIEVTSSTADDIAVIKIILPSPAPNDYKWCKFTKTDEWIDFSRDAISNGVGDGAEFNQDRTRVTLFITDNGPYDADAQAGIVRDPSGLGIPASAPPNPDNDNGGNDNVGTAPSASGGGGGGGGGCFINTARHETL